MCMTDWTKAASGIGKYDAQKVGGGRCLNCPLDPVCDGGCKSNNYMICGDMHEVTEMFCIWKRSITDSAYRIAKTLGDEGNELFVRTFNRWKGLRL